SSTTAPSTDSSTSSTTGAAPQAQAATSTDQPVEPTSLRPAEEVDGANASFTTNIPLQVPPFHGLEPQLALSYDSGRGNGFVGVGWTLSGLSVIERGSVRRGAPRYDTTDVFYLDGSELVSCTGISSPGCSAGGTHATRIESFLRIKQVTASNTWEVTRRD